MTLLWSGNVSRSYPRLQVNFNKQFSLQSSAKAADITHCLVSHLSVSLSLCVSLIIFEHFRKGCGASLQMFEDYSYQWRETIRTWVSH